MTVERVERVHEDGLEVQIVTAEFEERPALARRIVCTCGAAIHEVAAVVLTAADPADLDPDRALRAATTQLHSSHNQSGASLQCPACGTHWLPRHGWFEAA